VTTVKSILDLSDVLGNNQSRQGVVVPSPSDEAGPESQAVPAPSENLPSTAAEADFGSDPSASASRGSDGVQDTAGKSVAADASGAAAGGQPSGPSSDTAPLPALTAPVGTSAIGGSVRPSDGSSIGSGATSSSAAAVSSSSATTSRGTPGSATSTNSGSATASTGSTGDTASTGSTNVTAVGGVDTTDPALSGKFNLSLSAATASDYTVSASSYSNGSYTGAYDVFGATVDAGGIEGGSASDGYQISASTMAAIESEFVASQALPSVVGDINNGRVSPSDNLIIVEDEGSNINASFAAGTASVLLAQWSAIVSVVDYQASVSNGDLTIVPVSLLIPGGAGLEMNLAQLYNYLVRTSTSLYPGDINQSINNFFMNELGRAALSTDLSGWNGILYNTGSDLGLRQTLAYSNEASSNISSIYQALLGRLVDSPSLVTFQNELATGLTTIAAIRVSVAYSTEAASLISALYVADIGAAPSGEQLASWQAAFANNTGNISSLLNGLGDAAATAIYDWYVNDIGIPPTNAQLQSWIAAFANGTADIPILQNGLANTPEAATAIYDW
jgi:hypothetical protein